GSSVRPPTGPGRPGKASPVPRAKDGGACHYVSRADPTAPRKDDNVAKNHGPNPPSVGPRLFRRPPTVRLTVGRNDPGPNLWVPYSLVGRFSPEGLRVSRGDASF